MITSTLSASACSLSSLHVPEEAVPIPLALLNPIHHGLHSRVSSVCGGIV